MRAGRFEKRLVDLREPRDTLKAVIAGGGGAAHGRDDAQTDGSSQRPHPTSPSHLPHSSSSDRKLLHDAGFFRGSNGQPTLNATGALVKNTVVSTDASMTYDARNRTPTPYVNAATTVPTPSISTPERTPPLPVKNERADPMRNRKTPQMRNAMTREPIPENDDPTKRRPRR